MIRMGAFTTALFILAAPSAYAAQCQATDPVRLCANPSISEIKSDKTERDHKAIYDKWDTNNIKFLDKFSQKTLRQIDNIRIELKPIGRDNIGGTISFKSSPPGDGAFYYTDRDHTQIGGEPGFFITITIDKKTGGAAASQQIGRFFVTPDQAPTILVQEDTVKPFSAKLRDLGSVHISIETDTNWHTK